ncbi:MAG TPA: universal stress protein [Methylomirabilota bacterium]|nr:universal stress protein [Methylomirabilota bacterium]
MYSHKRALVALDGSPSSEAVLRFLLEIAGPLDMTVLLVRVLEPVPPVVTEGSRHMVIEDVEGRRRDAEEYLAQIAAALRAQGVETALEVRRGRPAEEILAAAREHRADLIAMATHGRTGLGRLLFGSVAEVVLRRAPVPVFMIRQPDAVLASPAPKEELAR